MARRQSDTELVVSGAVLALREELAAGMRQ